MGGDSHAYGAEFHALGPALRSLVTELSLWDVRASASGGMEVSINGLVDETCSFDGLVSRLAGVDEVAFDMGAVDRMNSAGVRNWCNFVARLDARRVSFRRCSVAFTSQACMVPNVTGSHGRIISVKAPYACERCEEEVERLVEVAQLRIAPQIAAPSFACHCGGELTLDDLPERYFAFAR